MCVARDHGMPRKQRFKPSRKPNPQPRPTNEEGGERREGDDIEIGESRTPSELDGAIGERSR